MRLFMMVLLIVFAIPLFANHALVNPVREALSNSIINSGEVSFSEQELFDSNIAVLAVGAKDLFHYMKVDARSTIPVDGTYNVDHSRRLTAKYAKYVGGGSRIKSGRH